MLLNQRCRILFFPLKRYWATHSLLFEICGIFFFPDPEKKIQSKNFRLFRFGPVNLGEPPPKWQKNDLMGYIFEKIQIHTMLSDFFVIKMVIEDLLSVFFFSEKVGSGKKKIPRFSLTHTFFEIFFPKVSFPGKNKIRHLCIQLNVYKKIVRTNLVWVYLR